MTEPEGSIPGAPRPAPTLHVQSPGGPLGQVSWPQGTGPSRSSRMAPRDAERFFVGACPIIATYGGRDRTLRGAADALRQSLRTAGVEHEVHEFPLAGHGFLNDHGPGEVPFLFQLTAPIGRTGHHGASAEIARDRIVTFLRRHLVDEVPAPPAT